MKQKNYPRLHIFIILFFLFNLLSAQNTDTFQSLKKEKDQLLPQILKSPNESLVKLQQIENRALKIGDQHLANECDIIRALYYYNTTNYQKTLEYCNKAIEQAVAYKYTDLQAVATGIIAMQYAKVGLKEEAIKTIEEAEKLAEMNNSIQDIEAQYNITIYHSSVLAICDSKKYALQCIELDEKTLKIAKQLNNKKYIIGALLNLSSSYIENKQYEKAQKVNNQLLKNKTEKSDVFKLYLYERIGSAYLHTRQIDSAIHYFNQGLSIANKLNMSEDKLNFMRELKEAYQAKDISEKKNKINLKYDTILSRQELKKNSALQISVKNILKKDQQKKENKINFFTIIIFICSILIIILSITYYFYYKKQKLSIDEKEKIIREKQASINTLQNIEQKNTLDEVFRYAVENNPLFLKKYMEYQPEFFIKLNSLSKELTTEDLRSCLNYF